MEKEIELYGMTLAELDTEVEIAKSAEVDEYVKTIKWSDDTDEYTKLLIVGNIRGFAFRKTTPETPINGFINKLAQRFAELTADRDALKAEVEAGKEQLREFAEDVAYQYAYERNGELTTGGLSTMEYTFRILGWDDPHRLAALEGESR